MMEETTKSKYLIEGSPAISVVMVLSFIFAIFYIVFRLATHKPDESQIATFANYPWDFDFALIGGTLLVFGGIGFSKPEHIHRKSLLSFLAVFVAVLSFFGAIISYGILRHNSIQETQGRCLEALLWIIRAIIAVVLLCQLTPKLITLRHRLFKKTP